MLRIISCHTTSEGFCSYSILSLLCKSITSPTTVPFVSPALRKHVLPYVPATDLQLENITTAARATLGNAERLVDLGSGDGRVVSLFVIFLLCTIGD